MGGCENINQCYSLNEESQAEITGEDEVPMSYELDVINSDDIRARG
jgi:hypothetical protein